MTAIAATSPGLYGTGKFERDPATRDAGWVRLAVLTVGIAYFAIFLLLPLFAVFAEAFRKGVEVYFAALVEPDALSAIRLTLLAAAIAIPLNLVSDWRRRGQLRSSSFAAKTS